jgi:hypothetical protein
VGKNYIINVPFALFVIGVLGEGELDGLGM